MLKKKPSAQSKKAKPAPKKKTVLKKTPVKAKALKTTSIKAGDKVPDFSLPATKVGEANLKSLKGKAFALYFYPKDDTPGCTQEACDFRDSLSQFNNLGVTVIGVSKDTLASHEKFAEKFKLTFPLASDTDGKVCEAFGVWIEKSMYGKSYMGIDRTTILVDKKGIVRRVWNKVSVPKHIDEIKAEAAKL